MSAYLNQVLINHLPRKPTDNDILNRTIITSRECFGDSFVECFYSGSYAKGTAIRPGSDIDIFISISNKFNSTLEDMYNRLYYHLQKVGCQVRKQNVSLGIQYNNFSVDLVPGQRTPNAQNTHFLYKNKNSSRIKTNIRKNIEDIANSGRLEEIKLIKIWRDFHKLDFPSCYLEYAVLIALSGYSYNNLENNFLRVISFLSSDLVKISISDPSNTNNIISNELNDAEKQKISLVASKCLNANYFKDIIQ